MKSNNYLMRKNYVKETLTFGTDGLRGNAQEFPFTSHALMRLVQAITLLAIKKFSQLEPRIIIAHDTRESCFHIQKHLIAGLTAHNSKCFKAGVLPSPAVLTLLKNDPSYDIGIMIS